MDKNCEEPYKITFFKLALNNNAGKKEMKQKKIAILPLVQFFNLLLIQTLNSVTFNFSNWINWILKWILVNLVFKVFEYLRI